MKLYYRISDKGYEKQKLLGATKKVCFENFFIAFRGMAIKGMADNCTTETIGMIQSHNCPVVETNLGNAKSLLKTLELAIEENSEDTLLYFCEDDYLHRVGSDRLLLEGIARADYVTLYDHPDKYTRMYNGGETSKVIKTASSHWRYTASTCMTFGVRVKTLKEDIDVWKEFTKEDHPHDHFIFSKLSEDRRRRLAVCIPGAACHTDLTFSGSVNHMLIEPWAIEMMIEQRGKDIAEKVLSWPADAQIEFSHLSYNLLNGKIGWQLLIALDALFTQTSIDNKKLLP